MAEPSTTAEKKIMAEYGHETLIDCGSLPASERVVSAQLLCSLLRSQTRNSMPVAGPQLAGVTVVGAMDLRFCDLGVPLRFRDCDFERTPLIGVARIASVEFRHCTLPGLWADRLSVEYLVNLDGSVITGLVSVVGMDIGHSFSARGTRIENAGNVALNATFACVGASVHISSGFEAAGQVLFSGARVAGDFDVEGASVTCDRSIDAIRLDRAHISGSVHGSVTTEGAFVLTMARIDSDVDLGGRISGRESGLLFDGAEVAGAVTLTGEIEGTVSGYDSSVGGMICVGSITASPSAEAINLCRARLRSNLEIKPGCAVRGEVTLLGASVRGGVLIAGACLSCDDGFAVVLDHSEIAGNVDIADKAKILGGVRLVEANIDGGFLAHDCIVDGAGHAAILGDRSQITGNIRLSEGVFVSGTISFAQARIGAALLLVSASLSSDLGEVLDFRYAQIGLGITLAGASITGGIDLGGADAKGIQDDLGDGPTGLGSWATVDPLSMRGFTYRELSGAKSYDRQLRELWLQQTTKYEPESWAQLQEVFRAAGRDDDGRRIAIAGHRDRIRRGGLSLGGRAWRRFLGATVGHGYAPARAGLWGLAIVAIFALLVWSHSDLFVPTTIGQAGTGTYPQPFVYAADVFVPVIDFNEADSWQPTDWMRGVQWTVIAAGWVVSTVLLAGFSRVVRD